MQTITGPSAENKSLLSAYPWMDMSAYLWMECLYQGTRWKRGQKECKKNQKMVRRAGKCSFLDMTWHCTHESTAALAICMISAQG